MSPTPDAHDETADAERLLEIVRALERELHPRRRLAVSLDSRLTRELGLDSLARVELHARIERAFGVSLPQWAFAAADTPRELLAAVRGAALPATPTAAAATAAPGPSPPPQTEAEPAPQSAESLVEVLRWHARRHPQRAHIVLLDDHAQPHTVITYGELLARAESLATGLLNHGLQPGETCAIMLPSCAEYFYGFFGALLAGGVPVPIYPPVQAAQLEEHVRRHARVLANAEARLLVTVPEARTVAALLRAQVPSLRAVVAAAELAATDARAAAVHFAEPRAGDLAFLQYTSGTTADPKGVMLTHANLLANIRAMGAAVRASALDVFVSWLPLYHDMGLIGAWLGTLYYATPLYLMSPFTFLRRPLNWLQAIHRYRATMSAGPNFAFELCLRRIEDSELAGVDLSSLRLLFNGAEPVSPVTLRRFTARFARYGLRPEAVTPVYGLAECALGLTFPPLPRPPLIDRIERETFTRTGRAVPAAADNTAALEFVACGRPLPGHQVRVVDAAGRELPERREGRLEFQGPSTTSGYFRNPEATRQLFHGDWLDSGDLAYVADGEVYITGRVKDVVIRAGRNIYPHELEEAIGDIPGIRKGCVAVFGSRDPASGTERLVVLAETRATDAAERERLQAAIVAAVTDLIGTPPDEVVVAPPHTVPKTSSGKIRRAASRALYERGAVGHAPPPVWWQLARLALAGIGPQLRLVLRATADLLYGLYAFAVFAVLAAGTWLVVALLPRPAWALAATRAAARTLIRMCLVPLHVEGREHLPPGSWVLVANHASYIDGIVLSAILPGVYHYVAKREFLDRFVARVFLRHIGAEFVERIELGRGVLDAHRLAGKARAGLCLVFFPEGTFSAQPGLHAFRLGAFVAAAEAGIPVVPVAIRGTREILRYPQWLPRRAPVHVVIGKPIAPAGSGWQAALRLRDAARAHILAHCGEADLAGE